MLKVFGITIKTARQRDYARWLLAGAAVLAVIGLSLLQYFLQVGSPGGHLLAAVAAATEAGVLILLILPVALQYRPRAWIFWAGGGLVAVGGSLPIWRLSSDYLPRTWALGVTATAALATLLGTRRYMNFFLSKLLSRVRQAIADAAHAEEVIRICEAELAKGKLKPSELSIARMNLATALVAQSASMDLADGLVRATDLLQLVVEDPENDWVQLLRVTSDLVDAMELKADKFGDMTGYAEAIELLKTAAEFAPKDAGGHAMVHMALSTYHTELMYRSGDDEQRERHADLVLEHNRLAIESVTRSNRELLPRAYSLLALRMVGSGRATEAEGIVWCRKAVQLARFRPRLRVIADLALASLLCEQAWSLAAERRPDEPAAVKAKGRQIEAILIEAINLCHRSKRWGSAPQRIEALETQVDAVEAYNTIFEELVPGERVEGIFMSAVSEAKRTSIGSVVRVTEKWVGWAERTEDPMLCAQAYYELVSLMPRLTYTRYLVEEKERFLGGFQNVASNAGYWLTEVGMPELAAEALELGRAVTLSELDQRASADFLLRLQPLGRSDLVTRYREALSRLEQAERDRASVGGRFSSPIQRAWTEFDLVRNEISKVLDSDQMLTHVSYAEIDEAAGDDTIVYLAATERGGYAVVVPRRGWRPWRLPLPEFTLDNVRHQVEIFNGLNGWGRKLSERERVHRVLRWLWEHGLERLDGCSPAAILTLVPVGLMGLLPVHAAGGPANPGADFEQWQYLSDSFVLRYAPNARMLRRAEACARWTESDELSLLAVDAPEAPDFSALRFTGLEVEAVATRWSDSARKAEKLSPAWRDEVQRALGRHQVWHFACHGRAEPFAVLDSALHLGRQPLSLRTLLQLPPSRRRLAVLSACESHNAGHTIPDEWIGMPAGMLQIGLAGVIAAHWRAGDSAAAFLMAKYYELWCAPERPEPAFALADAQRWLRNATHAELIDYLPGALEPPRAGSADEWLAQRPFVFPYRWAAFTITGV